MNRKRLRDAGFDGLLYACDPAPDLVKGQLPGFLKCSPRFGHEDCSFKVEQVATKEAVI